MNDQDELLSLVLDMLQQMDMRELDLIWRIVYGMSGRKEAQP